MAILFHGSEDIDIEGLIGPTQGRSFYTTTTTHRRTRVRSTYRISRYFTGIGVVTSPYFKFPTTINCGSVSFRFYSTVMTSTNYEILRLYNLDDGVISQSNNLRVLAGLGSLSFGYYNGSSDVILNEVSAPITTYTILNLTVEFDFRNLTNSIIRIFLNDDLKINYTGDLSNYILYDGYVDMMRVGSVATDSGSTMEFSEFIVSDSDTSLLHCGVSAFRPNANGSDAEMTGTYENIWTTIINDNTYLSSDTPGQKSSFIYNTLLDADDETIHALKLTARARCIDDGPDQLRFYFVLDNVKYYSGWYQIGPAWEVVTFNQNVRPDNGEKWTRDDLLAIEVGVESGSSE